MLAPHRPPLICALALTTLLTLLPPLGLALGQDSPRGSVRVAGIVLKWIRGDKQANYERAEKLIREAARGGARIVCTTECFLDGYAIADKSIPLEQFRALGEPVPEGPYFRRLAALADELDIHLVAGLLEADGQHRFNTALVIGPDGELIGRYRKQQLGHEALRNTAGGRSSVFATEHGPLGLMICADRRYKDLVRRLHEGGAEILLCPSGGMFGPRTNDPILQSRSRETGRHIVFVHPAEFLVTGPDGAIVKRVLLGDKLLIPPEQVGGEQDSQQVVYFDLPAAPADTASDADTESEAREALKRGLQLVKASADEYTEQRSCFSCHHQALPVMALSLAGRRGFDFDSQWARRQASFTADYFAGRQKSLLQGQGVPGGPFTAGYALLGMHAAGWAPDNATAALVAYLLETQQDDGRWKIRTHRPPMEDSDFTATALALRGLHLYGAAEQREEIEERILRARAWLEESSPQSTEDRVFHLWGLHWSGAGGGSIRQAAEQLTAAQRDDGGWSQLPEMASDAYATGQVLVALHRGAGTATDEAPYRRGLQFLRQDQQADGSWKVDTRSRPVQTYFESGFPHEKSQFISIAATCWALMALAEAH